MNAGFESLRIVHNLRRDKFCYRTTSGKHQTDTWATNFFFSKYITYKRKKKVFQMIRRIPKQPTGEDSSEKVLRINLKK